MILTETIMENENRISQLAEGYAKKMKFFQSVIDVDDFKQEAFLSIIKRAKYKNNDNIEDSHIHNLVRTGMRDLCLKVIRKSHYPYNAWIVSEYGNEKAFQSLISRELEPCSRIESEELKDVFYSATTWDGFSPQQKEVYKIILDGPTVPNHIIAKATGIKTHTFRSVRHQIMKKLRSFRPIQNLIKL